MEYIKVTLPAAPESLEDIAARLVAMGLDSFQTEDERDVLAQSPHWDMTDEALLEHYRGACRILVYLPRSPEGEESLAALREMFREVFCESVREEDWAENWKQYYEPILVGTRLVIHPEWIPLPEYPGRAVYLSNPGCSFGTGLHASTRLCLAMLEARDVGGLRVLDIGAGSGILGVCALLLGAAETVAADIDPQAADIARRSAEANHAGDRYTALVGDFANDKELAAQAGRSGDAPRRGAGTGFDLIFSNIVADVILALAPRIPELLAPNGAWIVSGIIDTRAEEVVEKLQIAGFNIVERLDEAGWVAMQLRVES